MTIRISTGLVNAMASNYGLGIMMSRGIINVYNGTQPTSADDIISGTLLGRVTTEGKVFIAGSDPNDAGLRLKLVSPGALINDGQWRLKGIATGTATWWRWIWFYDDPLITSTFYPRVDGAIGQAFKLANTSITASTDVALDEFKVTIPMSG